MMRLALIALLFSLVGCGKDEPPPPEPPKKSTKTQAEKADALLRNVTGKKETSVKRMQDAINANQQRALDQIEEMESK